MKLIKTKFDQQLTEHLKPPRITKLNTKREEVIEGDIIVQDLSVWIVQEDKRIKGPILTYNITKGKWIDGSNNEWDEWSIEPYEFCE